MGGDAEAIAEVGPEGDGVLLASLLQRQEGIAASSAIVTAGAAADLADGHRVTAILLRAVGVERNFGALKGDQQFAFAPLEAGKRRIKFGEAGGAAEQAVEPGLQTGLGLGRRIGPVKLEVAVEPPDQMAHEGDGGTLRLGHRHQAVDQTLGVDPAQAVTEHVELTGPIADDNGVLEQTMVVEAASDRSLTGQSYRLGAGDPERDQIVGPDVLIGKLSAVVSHQPLDQACRSVLLMQVD